MWAADLQGWFEGQGNRRAETETKYMWVLGLQVDFPVRKAAAPGTLENTVQTTVVYSDTLVRRTLSITLNKHHEMVSRCRAYSKWQNSHLWEFSYNNFVILSLKLKKNKQSICKLLNHVNALCLLETLMTRQLQGDNTCYKWSAREHFLLGVQCAANAHEELGGRVSHKQQ